MKVLRKIACLLLTAALAGTALPAAASAADVTTAAIEIEKRISGDKPRSAVSFTFLLKEENASEPFDAITVTGSGKAKFSPIEYNGVGSWHYTVTERDDGAEGYHYDDSVYHVTVTVNRSQATGALVPTITATKDDGQLKEPAIVFTNSYKQRQAETDTETETETETGTGTETETEPVTETETPSTETETETPSTETETETPSTETETETPSTETETETATGTETSSTETETQSETQPTTKPPTTPTTPTTGRTTTTTTTGSGTVKTGDNTPVALWLSLLGAGLALMLTAAILRRGSQKKRR